MGTSNMLGTVVTPITLMKGETLRTLIALVVVAVWAAAAVDSVITYQFKALEVVTPVMMIVTGFLFGYQIQVNRSGGTPRRRRDDHQ
jgi:ATP/ADP translocase